MNEPVTIEFVFSTVSVILAVTAFGILLVKRGKKL